MALRHPYPNVYKFFNQFAAPDQASPEKSRAPEEWASVQNRLFDMQVSQPHAVEGRAGDLHQIF